jgi:spermidine synthase
MFGVRATLYGAGLALALLGLCALAADKKRAKNLAVALAAAGAGGFFGFGAWSKPMKPAGTGATLLAERESREQYLRVIEKAAIGPSGATERERWMQVNEGLDSFQSLDAPDRKSPGHYYDMLAFTALFRGDWDSPRIALVGSGAGSTARATYELLPSARITGFELDPAVGEIARSTMRLAELEARGYQHWGGIDGRAGVRATRAGCDAILIDAYARQVEIPFHLISLEMFSLCFEKLAAGGILAINVSSFGDSDPILRSVARTLEAAAHRAAGEGARVQILRVRRDHNSIVFARKSGEGFEPAKWLDRFRGKSQATAIAKELAQYALSPGAIWQYSEKPGDVLLTDDHAPVERLQAESLRLATKDWN